MFFFAIALGLFVPQAHFKAREVETSLRVAYSPQLYLLSVHKRHFQAKSLLFDCIKQSMIKVCCALVIMPLSEEYKLETMTLFCYLKKENVGLRLHMSVHCSN